MMYVIKFDSLLIISDNLLPTNLCPLASADNVICFHSVYHTNNR